MSQTKLQDTLVGLFNFAPIKKTFGLVLEYDAEGNAICRLPRNGNLDHGGQDTHGGVLATMLDTAGWFTVASKCGQAVLTSDLHVRMLQPAKRQDLVATARVVRLGSKSVVAEMKVHTEGGDLVAMATASFAIIGALPSL